MIETPENPEAHAALDQAIQRYFAESGALAEGEFIAHWVIVAGCTGEDDGQPTSPTVTTASPNMPIYVAKGLFHEGLDIATQQSHAD